MWVRVGGIEPPSHPWQGCILPLNHTRIGEQYQFILAKDKTFTMFLFQILFVPGRGFEPPPSCEDSALNAACLPISPPGPIYSI